MKILIVEDEFNAREGLAALIQKNCPQHEICGKAADGAEGFEMAAELKPDLVFADIELPKLNGLQMIRKIAGLNQNTSFVILSGYAEFDYAQQAIRYGVSEYLLKPITYDKLINVITNMENLQTAQKPGFGAHFSPDEILKSIFSGQKSESREALKVLRRSEFRENIYLVNVYYGRNPNPLGIVKAVNTFCEYYGFQNCFSSVLHEHRFVTFLICSRYLPEEMANRMNHNLLLSLNSLAYKDFTVTLLSVQDVNRLPEMLAAISSLNAWAITLGNDHVLREELVSGIGSEANLSVEQFDMRALSAIKNGLISELSTINDELLAYLRLKKCPPEQIKNICANYILSILVCYREFKVGMTEKTKDLILFDKLKSCCTLEEIKACLDSLADIYHTELPPSEKVNSILVRKTLNHIAYSYQDRVSLEEIANNMNISPEYLSHLFTKELGISFSDYLKKYRVNIAKKLLATANSRIYEIGEQVGYKDPKYFSKIFKEVTGFTPKEYMKK